MESGNCYMIIRGCIYKYYCSRCEGRLLKWAYVLYRRDHYCLWCLWFNYKRNIWCPLFCGEVWFACSAHRLTESGMNFWKNRVPFFYSIPHNLLVFHRYKSPYATELSAQFGTFDARSSSFDSFQRFLLLIDLVVSLFSFPNIFISVFFFFDLS